MTDDTEPVQPPLPPIEVAQIDADDLARLIDDLRSLTNIQRIETRPALHNGPDNPQPPVTLKDLPALLDDARINAVQLQYTYQGHHWVDTLSRTDAGFKLVRYASQDMAH